MVKVVYQLLALNCVKGVAVVDEKDRSKVARHWKMDWNKRTTACFGPVCKLIWDRL